MTHLIQMIIGVALYVVAIDVMERRNLPFGPMVIVIVCLILGAILTTSALFY